MAMVDITEIKKKCSMVRTAAYRSYINGDLPVGKETPFPNGLCGWVSIVLGAVLSNEFPDEMFFYVSGMSGEMSHAWIEYYDYVIDITADQFQEVTEEVLIVQRSDSSLHTRFEIEKSVRLNDEFLKYYLHYKEENSIYQEYLKLKQLPRNVEL